MYNISRRFIEIPPRGRRVDTVNQGAKDRADDGLDNLSLNEVILISGEFWLSGDFYMRPRPGNCPRKRGVSNHNPDVPHAVGTVCDVTRPRDQGFLHSELIAAVYLLKAQIGSPSRYLGHHVCPVRLHHVTSCPSF